MKADEAAYVLSQLPEGQEFFKWLEDTYINQPVARAAPKIGSVDPLAMAMRAGAQGLALDIKRMIERGRNKRKG